MKPSCDSGFPSGSTNNKKLSFPERRMLLWDYGSRLLPGWAPLLSGPDWPLVLKCWSNCPEPTWKLRIHRPPQCFWSVLLFLLRLKNNAPTSSLGPSSTRSWLFTTSLRRSPSRKDCCLPQSTESHKQGSASFDKSNNAGLQTLTISAQGNWKTTCDCLPCIWVFFRTVLQPVTRTLFLQMVTQKQKKSHASLTHLILVSNGHVTQSTSQSRPNLRVWQRLLSPNISQWEPTSSLVGTHHALSHPCPCSSCLLCQENPLPSLCQYTFTPSTLFSNGTPSRNVPLLLHHHLFYYKHLLPLVASCILCILTSVSSVTWQTC